MKITKTKLAAASFGAALTSMYSAPELNAQVVDLTFTPSIVPFNPYFARFTPVVFGIPTSNGVSLGSLDFYNQSFARTLFGPPSLSNVASVDPGDVFSNGFVSDKRIYYSSGIFIPATLTGIETFGFLFSGQAGFFRVDFGQ